MNVSDIQVFGKVAATGSFSDAAAQLGITRSAVSKAVSRLEKQLGVTLLNRSPRSTSLTEAGRVFFEHSMAIDDALERAVASVSGADQRPTGNVSCSMPSSLGAALMTPLIRKFRDVWPEVTLDLHFDDRYVDLIGSSIDVAIRVAPKLDDSNLLSRRIGTTRKILVASPAYLEMHGRPASIPDLKNHHCLAVGSAARRRVTWRCESTDGPAEVMVNCHTTSNSVLALILAACLDDGIIYVPELFVSGELREGVLTRVLSDCCASQPFGVFAVYPSQKPPAKVRALIDFLEQELPQLDTMERWAPLPRQLRKE